MINITLLDKSVKTVENMTVIEFAKTLSTSLAKKTVGAFVDGKQVDITYFLDKDCKLELILQDSEKGLEILRHSCAHVMAEAVLNLFPNTKVTIECQLKMVFTMILIQKDHLLKKI